MRSGRWSNPTASQSPATARHSWSSSGRSATAIETTTRVAPAANARRILSAPSMPPATWSGTATREATRPKTSRLAGPARGSVHVDDVDHLRAGRHEPFRDPLGPVGG